MSYLVDTDRVIDFLGDRSDARSVVAPLIAAGRLSTSIIVLAEVHEGLIGRPQRSSASSVFDEFLTSVRVLGVTEPTARSFASLRLALRTSGQIINDHDIWIAATALEHDFTLISRDRHFDRIPGLKLLR